MSTTNVVSLAEYRHKRELETIRAEHVAHLTQTVIPELASEVDPEKLTSDPQQFLLAAIVETLNGFTRISPSVTPLLVVSQHTEGMFFSVSDPERGIEPLDDFYMKFHVAPSTAQFVPDIQSAEVAAELCNRTHQEQNWHTGKEFISPVGVTWSFLTYYEWDFIDHQVDVAQKIIQQTWQRDDQQFTITLNHRNLEAAIEKWKTQ